jgi:predicted RNA-binding Zn ribbon-like protein
LVPKIFATQPGFEFIGDSLAMDFANTFGGLPPDSITQDRLRSYRHLINWSYQAGLISEIVGDELLRSARSAPAEADAVLARARALRDAIRVLFTAIAMETPLNEDALKALNRELEHAMAGGWVMPSDDGFDWDWPKDESALDQMIAPVVRSAAQLLTSAADRQLVRKCANPQCPWLFVDRTKSHRRQYCKTSGCGNTMRIRKYREGQRKQD